MNNIIILLSSIMMNILYTWYHCRYSSVLYKYRLYYVHAKIQNSFVTVANLQSFSSRSSQMNAVSDEMKNVRAHTYTYVFIYSTSQPLRAFSSLLIAVFLRAPFSTARQWRVIRWYTSTTHRFSFLLLQTSSHVSVPHPPESYHYYYLLICYPLFLCIVPIE